MYIFCYFFNYSTSALKTQEILKIHQRRLSVHKIESHGISSNVAAWIGEWLNDRKKKLY